MKVLKERKKNSTFPRAAQRRESVTAYLSKDDKNKLKFLVKQSNTNLSEVIRQMIRYVYSIETGETTSSR